MSYGGVDHFARLEIVGGDDDIDIVDRSKCRQIVQRVMRRAEHAVADAGADADDFHGIVGIGDVVLDLLERGAVRKQAGETA